MGAEQFLRKAKELVTMTKEDVLEYVKCKKDIYYFLENYFTIFDPEKNVDAFFHPLPFQREIIDHTIGLTDDPRMHTLAKIPRQSGKTTVASGIILHDVLFSESKSTVLCLSRELKSAIDIMNRIKYAFERIPKWMSKGVTKYNETSIEFEDGSYIYSRPTTANSGRGLTISRLYWDEACFIPANIAQAFMQSVMPAISRNPKARILITSTPNGLDHFYDLWQKATLKQNDYKPIEAPWNCIPSRDETFKRKVIADYGMEYFLQEFCCRFIGSSNTLIGAEALESLVFQEPIQMKFGDTLKIYELPIPRQKGQKFFYVMGVDTAMGVGKDSSVIQVIKIWLEGDVVKWKQVATYRNNRILTTEYAEVVLEIGKFYNNAVLMIENNDVGGNVATMLWYKFEYENIVNLDEKGIGIRSTNTLKNEALMNMKRLIDSSPESVVDKETIHELGTFEEVRSGVFKGKGQKHDDTVMALAWGLYITETEDFEEFGFALPEAKLTSGKYAMALSGGKEEAYNPETDDFF